MGRRENAVTEACLKYLRAAGLMAWRNNTGMARYPDPKAKGGFRKVKYGANGSPDVVAVLPPAGRILCVECKRPEDPFALTRARRAAGTQSPDQIQFQALVEASGGIYLVATSTRALDPTLREAGLIV